MSTRVIAYVDGFNLFHAVDDLVGHHHKRLRIPHNKVDLWALMEDRKKDGETLSGIHYFSAYATWKPDKIVSSHKRYVRALEGTGVNVTMSQFKEKRMSCNKCGAKWIGHEEKETDMRIGLQMLTDATDDLFDRAYIISADSDMVAAVRVIRERFPEKEIVAMAPPQRYKRGRDLMRSAHVSVELKPFQIKRCLFDPKVLRPTKDR